MTSHPTAMPAAWADFVDGSLRRLQEAQLSRSLRPLLPSLDPMQVTVEDAVLQSWVADDANESQAPYESQALQQHAIVAAAGVPPSRQMQNLRLFSSNDYLGLSTHSRVRHAAAEAALAFGSGPRSSALVGGYTQQHADLEAALAELKGKEAALLFPTGFAANVGTITALASGGGGLCHIFSDALNHASIIDGARLATRSGRAQLHVFRHSDLGHLEELLAAVPEGERRLVVTDSLFSMDGDWVDLRGLAALKQRHPFLLVIDEAHASLVTGPRGGGLAEALGVTQHVDVIVGTLSKGFGAHGGFVACVASLKRLLLNAGRPYIFSTALPAPVVAAAHAALLVAQQEVWRREHLTTLWELLGKLLGVRAVSPIVPLVVGSEADALAATAALLGAGFYVPAIRPPTVPPSTSRLRISLSAAHTTEDVEALVAAIQGCGIALPSAPDLLQRQPGVMGAEFGAAAAATGDGDNGTQGTASTLRPGSGRTSLAKSKL